MSALYTFINGQKKYIMLPKTVVVTIDPYYSAAAVNFSSYSTGSIISGNSIIIPYDGYVSGNVSATNHDTVYFNYSNITDDITYRPHLPRTVISPVIYYNSGACYQVASWDNRGQNIAGGTYTYSRGDTNNTWIVTTNDNGEVTGLNASGIITMRTSGGPVTLTPVGGWNSLGLVD